MSVSAFDLETLIAPITQEEFFRDYWEKQPLIIRREQSDRYSGLLSMADADQVIAFSRPKFVDPAAFSQEPPRAKTFVQGWLADRQLQEGASYPGIEELRGAYAQGKTVIIMTMQQRWLPVAKLCRNLEALFHFPVHANMYLTPAGAQGFDAHFDPHEVLVLQLEGTKHWRLYGPARKYPLVDERFNVPKDELGNPREVHLEPGDLLYIPRGHVHEAFTSECASLHLTVGINIYRWADLLHDALDSLARRDDRFRESIPPGVLGGGELPEPMRERFRDLLEALSRSAHLEEAVHRLGDQFFGQLPVLPDGGFAPCEEADGIDLETVLEKAPGAVCRVVHDGGWVVLEYPGGRVGGPRKIAAALQFVACNDRFAVRALPDALGSDGKLVLARRFVRERLLKIAGRVETSEPAAVVQSVSGSIAEN